MSSYTAGKAWKETKEQHILENAFQLFSKKGIETVSMPEIAAACNVGRATLYRYFSTKLDLVVAVGAWSWDVYIRNYNAEHVRGREDTLTGAEWLCAYMDSFIDLYRNHRNILCFNYDFNSYLRRELIISDQLMAYTIILRKLHRNFHRYYQRGIQDQTLNAKISEAEMFSASFHIMMAAASRYAVGLIYIPEKSINPESELVMLKDMLLSRFLKEGSMGNMKEDRQTTEKADKMADIHMSKMPQSC